MKSPIKDNEGLNALLTKWHTEKKDPIKSFVELRPEKTLTARKLIENKWGDVTPKEPKPFELTETLNIIRSAWRKEGKIDHIRLRHLRRIPYILFYDTKPWLGEDYAFTEAFLAWLWATRNSSCIVSLLREFLHEYPQKLPTFDLLRNALIKLLDDTKTIRLSRWRDRCEKYHFLQDKDEAPVYFAQEWLNSDLDGFEMLNDHHASLLGKLAKSQFMLCAHNKLFNKLKRILPDRNISISKNKLKRALLLAETEDNELRFAEHKNIVESLLLPFAQGDNPDAEYQKLIEDFILNHMGDPRYGYKTSSKWYGIDDRAKEVIIRWRVKVTLDDFFRLLDVTALDKHWKYRHRFWEAYLKMEHITAAWVILGKEAKTKAKDILENKDYAEGKGMTKNQAVLLLKVGGITLAEWSHNGACRIWLQSNAKAPEFYKFQYDGADFRIRSDESIPHLSSESGNWQIKLAGKIEELTGIHMPYNEYMVSGDGYSSSGWRGRVKYPL